MNWRLKSVYDLFYSCFQTTDYVCETRKKAYGLALEVTQSVAQTGVSR